MITTLQIIVLTFAQYDIYGSFDRKISKELLRTWKPPISTEIDTHLYGDFLEKYIKARILLENNDSFSFIGHGQYTNMFVCSKIKNVNRIDCCLWDRYCYENNDKTIHFENLCAWHESYFPDYFLTIGNIDIDSKRAWSNSKKNIE